MKIIQVIATTERVYNARTLMRDDNSYREYVVIYGLGDDGVLYQKVTKAKKDVWKKVITSDDVK